MPVTVRYFASLRERLGTDSESLSIDDSATTVGAVHERLMERGGVWSEAFGSGRVLSAINHEMAAPDSEVVDGDEVAFFPPVTGG
ncbi:MAG: molybdopterin converting factor subunit 1 [Gammaproteobacteria bacterium]